jgi:DNA-binding IclR family transcriptional regulator
MKKREKTDYLVQSLAYALDIMEQFHADGNEVSIFDIRKKLKLNKKNATKLLATLALHDFVELDKETNNYRLGIKTFQLGQTAVKQMNIHSMSIPILKSLTDDCNETCWLGVMKDNNVVCLDTVESTLPVRIAPKIGMMLPVFCTAAGKVLLAGAIDRTQRTSPLFMELMQYTPNTITDPTSLARQLEMIATQGYALEDEELDLGVRGVAAPIRNYTSQVVGAISISGPVMRFSKSRIIDELVPMVKRAGDEISMRAGYSISTIAGMNR